MNFEKWEAIQYFTKMTHITRIVMVLALLTGTALAQTPCTIGDSPLYSNENFTDSVPWNATGAGWTSSGLCPAGGWQKTGGAPGSWFVLYNCLSDTAHPAILSTDSACLIGGNTWYGKLRYIALNTACLNTPLMAELVSAGTVVCSVEIEATQLDSWIEVNWSVSTPGDYICRIGFRTTGGAKYGIDGVSLPPWKLDVLSMIDPDTLPVGYVGMAYTCTLTSILGAPDDDYVWTVASPPGDMTLDSPSGVLTWTPQSSDMGNTVVLVTVKLGSNSETETITIPIEEQGTALRRHVVPPRRVFLRSSATHHAYSVSGRRVHLSGQVPNGAYFVRMQRALFVR